MLKILLARLGQCLLMAWSVGTLTFILTRLLPGDMAYKIATGRYGDDAVSTAAANAVNAELGLDRPAFQQYLMWLGDLITGDLGTSLVTGAPVVHELQNQMSFTLVLAFWAILAAALIAFPVGLLCGAKAETVPDRASLITSTFIRSQPVFCLGLLLIFIFAMELNWFPVAGFGSAEYAVLPVLTLALSLAAVSNRVVRNSTRQAVNSAYFHFARTKGLSYAQAFTRHVVPNVIVPGLAFMGIQLIGLIEGVIMVESLFAWPGIGHGLSHAVFARDIPMLQGTALVMGMLFVAINTLVDISQHYLDPRTRLEK